MNFAPGAWRYALVPLLVAPFALLISVGASVAAFAVGLATLAFFRDPDRSPPPTGAVVPADGKVSVIRTESDRLRVGVFMNVHNVHVVRSPFDATVAAVDHEPGAYKPAFSKDSDRNEKVHVRLEEVRDLPTDAADAPATSDEPATADEKDGDDSEPVDDRAEVTFIAGAFARRIHPYVEAGDELERGQRIGHIAFGSRVDVLFPPGVDRDDLAVERGETVTAGETPLLRVADDELIGETGLDAEFGAASDDGGAVDERRGAARSSNGSR